MKCLGLKRSELLILLISAVVIMLFVSASSPLYPFNVWDDTNVYFSVGRGILEGSVPYRDLYEQKGPIFLFMYALSALISRTDFTGLWVFECLAAFVFAVFSWKSVKLFVDPPVFVTGIVPVYMSAVYTIGMFNFGGSTEEFCFPLLSVALYIALKMIRRAGGTLPSSSEALVCGIITSILFWTKYTFLGFMAGFILIIIIKAVKYRKIKELGKDILFFLTGFVALSVPVFIYFGVNGALSSLWDSYFINNIFNYYASTEYSGIYAYAFVRFFMFPVMGLITSFRMFPDYAVMMLLSLAGVIFFERKYRKDVLIMVLVTMFVSLKFIFSRSIFIYYYGYILSFFFVFALILVVRGIKFLLDYKKERYKIIQLLSVLCFAVITANLLFLCKNIYLISVDKEDLSQFKFAQIINQTEDAKIITYDIIDGGFYLASGVSPCNRYFTYMNFIENNEEAIEEQDRLVEEGYFDYIITYYDGYDWDNYELISQSEDDYCDYTKEFYVVRYCIYQRVDG